MLSYTYCPCDLNGCGTQDNRIVQANYDLAELLLYVPVVHTLSWRAYIYKRTRK